MMARIALLVVMISACAASPSKQRSRQVPALVEGAGDLEPPPALAPRPFELPPLRAWVLGNGIHVTVLELPGTTKCAIAIGLRNERVALRAHQNDVVTTMMQDGSSLSSGFRFNEDLDRIRASLDVTAKHDLFELQVTLPSAAVVEGTSLAASILQTPSLDPERFTHRKAQLRTFYEDWSTRVRNTMLNREVARALLGDEHRYVRAAGDARTLEDLDFQESASAYTQVLQPDSTLVAAAGACPGLDQTLARTIGAWKQTAPPGGPRKAAQPMRNVPRTLLLFNEPATRSSNFRWALTLPSVESQEWVHALVAREVLSVRLRHRFEFERRLTDDFGLARIDSLAGSWLELWGSAESGVTSDVLLAFSRELDAMSTQPSQEELESARRRVVFDLVNAAQSPKWMSSRILDWMMHGVLARAASFERIVMAVTADQVAAVGRNYLSAARGALIVMGPRDAVKPKLTELGWGRVIDGGTVGVSTTSGR